jgi:NADPH-dependent 2,4-dienoyl-CoA reductase/sulfur reductase-like enzyme
LPFIHWTVSNGLFLSTKEIPNKGDPEIVKVVVVGGGFAGCGAAAAAGKAGAEVVLLERTDD